MSGREYHEMVGQIEAGLAPYAKRSFEENASFVDGRQAFKHFHDLWSKPETQATIRQRTPIQLERDRILYSQNMRKLTEKYHVLYNGDRKIVRSFATHTMKMAQVARAICRGLSLNQDFAEAIALGAKVGSVPFVHAAKQAISDWAEEKIISLDKAESSKIKLAKRDYDQLKMDFNSNALPDFVSRISSPGVLTQVRRFMPWAAGRSDSRLYSSGQEGYWLLCTNPFIADITKAAYLPDTMYGIWRHTRGLVPGKDPFHHRCEIDGPSSRFIEITDQHATFEAIVVQYADDITWVIENLNDASDVAILNGRDERLYAALEDELKELGIPSALKDAMSRNDASGIYTYFISDFVEHSNSFITANNSDVKLRNELSTGRTAGRFGLSGQADRVLQEMVKFLEEKVFSEPRTKNRTVMLKAVSLACVNLIYDSEDMLPRVVSEQSKLGRWKSDTKALALSLLGNEVHRIQLSMDVLASWGDQEIYDLVGMQSL